jgi:hypothetical protein
MWRPRRSSDLDVASTPYLRAGLGCEGPGERVTDDEYSGR